GVQGVYDIILHGYGPNLSIGSLHISVPDTMDANQIHGLTRKISEMMLERHGIIMTVGIYANATGNNHHAALQKEVIQMLTQQEHVIQVHGFYYYESDNRVLVDVVPDMTVTDDQAFINLLTEKIKPILKDQQISIVIDHNYCD
ncbi:MAG: cation transporter, partial [Bacteroidaceae bacterium]|nr:cation transporter [Bacteroidaceae bacterium]